MSAQVKERIEVKGSQRKRKRVKRVKKKESAAGETRLDGEGKTSDGLGCRGVSTEREIGNGGAKFPQLEGTRRGSVACLSLRVAVEQCWYVRTAQCYCPASAVSSRVGIGSNVADPPLPAGGQPHRTRTLLGSLYRLRSNRLTGTLLSPRHEPKKKKKEKEKKNRPPSSSTPNANGRNSHKTGVDQVNTPELDSPQHRDRRTRIPRKTR